jgi:hypothetical protein
MIVESKYNLGDIVYLKTDKEQNPRMITSIAVRPLGCTYELSLSTTVSWHYDFEFSLEENVIFKTQ